MRYLTLLILTSSLVFGGDNTSKIALEAAYQKLQQTEVVKKVPRSECPECKGTGKVKGGDTRTIVMRECENCYDDGKSGSSTGEIQIPEAATPEITLHYYWATWCGPCRQMSPIIARLKAQGVNVTKYDVSNGPNMTVPALIFKSDGKQVAHKVGVMSEATILKLIEGFEQPTTQTQTQSSLTPAQLRAWCKTTRCQKYYVRGMTTKEHLLTGMKEHGYAFAPSQLFGLTESELMKIHGGLHLKYLTPNKILRQ